MPPCAKRNHRRSRQPQGPHYLTGIHAEAQNPQKSPAAFWPQKQYFGVNLPTFVGTHQRSQGLCATPLSPDSGACKTPKLPPETKCGGPGKGVDVRRMRTGI